MRIPVTVNRNALQTYLRYDENRKVKNSLQSDNLFWDHEIPKSLQEICLEAIATNWKDKPLLDEIPLIIDRCFLLNILSTDLKLTLTVPKIEDDIFWKRCYLEKWPKNLPKHVRSDFQIVDIVKTENGSRKSSNSSIKLRKNSDELDLKRKWKECFLETYIREYLERLKPEDYDAEKIKELSDLCGPFVKTLELRELQSAENSPNRIPLNAILTGIKNLQELSIYCKQIYVGEKFSWNVLQMSQQDVKLLAKGLEKCHLKIFRLKNSDIDDEKLKILLKSLLKHDDLQVLDFSHCKIANDGLVALSKFSLQVPVRELILANNNISAEGVEALCYAVCKLNCKLETLDLKLNQIGSEGARQLMIPLMMGVRNLKNLYLNGCKIENVSSIGEMIEHNSYLRILDLSNNSLGEEMGKIILQGLRFNKTLVKLDVRMCKLSPDHEFEILLRINKNRTAKRRPRINKPIIIEPQFSFDISDEMLMKMESIFENVEELETQDEVEEVEDEDVNLNEETES